jgi:hypothetical protein
MSQTCHFQTHAPQQQLHSITSTAQINFRFGARVLQSYKLAEPC